MDPLSTIDAAVRRGKASIEATTAIRKRLEQLDLSSEDRSEIRQALLDLESQLLESQNEILGLKGLLLEVQQENFELKKKHLDQAEEAATTPASSNYQLLEIGGASVWVRTGTVRPYYCPTCFSGDTPVALQRSTSMFSVTG
ncbi:MAG: hypothetical protein AAGD06_12040, partial [Acidobacteriota bacterium]